MNPNTTIVIICSIACVLLYLYHKHIRTEINQLKKYYDNLSSKINAVATINTDIHNNDHSKHLIGSNRESLSGMAQDTERQYDIPDFTDAKFDINNSEFLDKNQRQDDDTNIINFVDTQKTTNVAENSDFIKEYTPASERKSHNTVDTISSYKSETMSDAVANPVKVKKLAAKRPANKKTRKKSSQKIKK